MSSDELKVIRDKKYELWDAAVSNVNSIKMKVSEIINFYNSTNCWWTGNKDNTDLRDFVQNLGYTVSFNEVEGLTKVVYKGFPISSSLSRHVAVGRKSPNSCSGNKDDLVDLKNKLPIAKLSVANLKEDLRIAQENYDNQLKIEQNQANNQIIESSQQQVSVKTNDTSQQVNVNKVLIATFLFIVLIVVIFKL